MRKEQTPLFAVILRPSGRIARVGFTREQARTYCDLFGRLLPEQDARAEAIRLDLDVSLPRPDQTPEQS